MMRVFHRHRRSSTTAVSAQGARSIRQAQGHSSLSTLNSQLSTAVQRPGFTLTEMLVATALTLIILLIFAQVYRTATATIVQQRGIGQNDARARMMSTILRNDLQKATFRDHPQSGARGLLTLGIYDFEQLGFSPLHKAQAGYFYVSENDPDNDVDDVLQFTVNVSQNARNDVDYPYVGKASRIARPTGATPGGGSFNPTAGAGNPDRNQPEFDDGNNGNGASQSRFAEVVYFVRNGTLYRRVMLLRDPTKTTRGQDYDPTPTYIDNTTGEEPLIPGNYDAVADVDANSTLGQQDFWHDFDFSAFHSDPADVAIPKVEFLGKDSLANAGRGVGNTLGDPRYRWGFQYRSDADPNRYRAGGQTGCNPVEYINMGQEFIGRFTHQETSDSDFVWPGRFAPNPFLNPNALSLTANGEVNGLHDDPDQRRGEDIVLTNVDAFDVKLFQLQRPSGVGGQFVDVGHTGTGALSRTERTSAAHLYSGAANPYEGAQLTRGNIFDTWHPDNYPLGSPPYRPLIQLPPDPGALAPDPVYGSWRPNTTYNLGDRIFPFTVIDFGADHMPGIAGTDDDTDLAVDERDEAAAGVGDDFLNYYDGIFYEVVGIAGGAASGVSSDVGFEPTFLKRYEERIVDNDLLWQCYDNRMGVPLIQITVRYRDPASGLSRQLTIQHTLTDRAG